MSDLISGAETDVESALSGGQLEKAYLLILPPASPAGGIGALAAGAAGIGAEDLAGNGSAGSTLQTADSTVSGAAGNRVSFMFNPRTYTIEKSAEWIRYPDTSAFNAAVPQFRGTAPRSMTVDVLLDATYTNGDISSDVDLLFSCCKPTMVSLLMKTPSPPFVIFGWGATLGFLSYMENVRAEYTLFKQDGTPLRANCSLTMREIPMPTPSQNPTSGGTARRTRTVVAGDTLQSISFKEYGKATYWRAIADLNGIDDPTRIGNGTTLLIPPLSEASVVS